MARIAEARRLTSRVISTMERSVPYELHFLPAGVTLDQKSRAILEEDLKNRFENWARTWVTPQLEQAIKALDGVAVNYFEDLSR